MVRVAVEARNPADAQRAERIIAGEFDRLVAEFNRDDPASLMRRWIADPSVATSSEFDELLAVALRWQQLSDGVFNVSTHQLQQVWARAALDGCRPSAGQLRDITTEIARAPYRFDGHRPRQVAHCGGIDLGAIIPGFILDCAFDAAWRLCDLDALTVWTKHRARHRGSVPMSEPLAHPNERLRRRLATLEVADGAVVVRDSSRTRDVFDPRSGIPVLGPPTAAIVSPCATTGDALATVLALQTVGEGEEFVETLNARSARSGSAASNAEATIGPIRCWWFDESGRDLGAAESSLRSPHRR